MNEETAKQRSALLAKALDDATEVLAVGMPIIDVVKATAYHMATVLRECYGADGEDGFLLGLDVLLQAVEFVGKDIGLSIRVGTSAEELKDLLERMKEENKRYEHEKNYL